MRKILCGLAFVLMVVMMCSGAGASGQFNATGIFGVPVNDVNVSMRTFSEHNNEPRGVDLSVGYGTAIYSPFTGTLQYYRRSDIINGERQSVSYGNC